MENETDVKNMNWYFQIVTTRAYLSSDKEPTTEDGILGEILFEMEWLRIEHQ